MGMFRALRADEVELRVGSIREKGASFLLYKDARCDMNILDETVGPMNWQRLHNRDNANCVVSIWNEKEQQWISKEDTGTESNTEREKGLASDSFKRACVNWGIGRELYTAPFIWISADKYEATKDEKGKLKLSLSNRFAVEKMKVVDGTITELEISNTLNGKKSIVYSFGMTAKKTKSSDAQSKQTSNTNETEKTDTEPIQNSYKCEVCGKPLTEEFAKKSAAANDGHVYCSGRCRRERPVEGVPAF